MATKSRRKTTRRKTTKKRNYSKKRQQNFDYKIITGLIAEIFLAIGAFRLGLVGNFLADIYKYVFGDYFVIFILLIAVFLGYWLLYQQKPRIAPRFYWAFFLFAIPFLVISSLLFRHSFSDDNDLIGRIWEIVWRDIRSGQSQSTVGGGLIGMSIYLGLCRLISDVGVWIAAIFSVLFGIFRLINRSFLRSASKAAKIGRAKINDIQLSRENGSHLESNFFSKYFEDPDQVEKKSSSDNDRPAAADKNETPKEDVKPQIRWNHNENNSDLTSAGEQSAQQTTFNKPAPASAPDDFDQMEEENSKDPSKDQIVDSIETQDDPNYEIPPTSILSQVKMVDQTGEYKQLTRKSQIVRDTLKSFNIDTDVSSVSLGPTVTQYELKPARGVKVSTIANRADDLALALSAKSIRIEAPIPGKPFVGVEVPNEVQATVGFSDVIENSKFNSKHPLTVPLGRDVNNEVISADLASMPHLLIAGSTGSGKSVAINGIISSLLMRLKPNQVKLMMVDPKRVELSMYNNLPHLLAPVISEPRKAARGLQKAVKEMEHRYELFADHGVRNIDGWNKKVDQYNSAKGKAMPRLPYIVIIVDELADLMMTAKGDVENSIVRIAQMGRAAGVHLILATQRPSVDVITGLIKANVPSRIAFAVSSGIDSRTILDQNGAEKLLGKGDMLFAPVGKEPMRIQGAFISDRDVESITDFIRSESQAQYAASMLVDSNDSDDDQDSSDPQGQPLDELFQDASDFVISQKKASTSMLQRRFRIGYNRAARIIDELEAAGIVGPQDGSRPREVLGKPNQKTQENDS